MCHICTTGDDPGYTPHYTTISIITLLFTGRIYTIFRVSNYSPNKSSVNGTQFIHIIYTYIVLFPNVSLSFEQSFLKK